MDNITQAVSQNPFDNITISQAQQAVSISALLPDAGCSSMGGALQGNGYQNGFESSALNNDGGRGAGGFNWLRVNELFYKGNHWQGSLGWVGPQPLPSDPSYPMTMKKIYRQFVSKNMIREVTRRHVGGVLGRNPNWNLTLKRPLGDGEAPNPDEQAVLDEANAALMTWWNLREAHKLLQEAMSKACYAGRGPLRIYVPEGRLDDMGEVPNTPNAQDAIEYIHLDTPEPEQAAIIEDSRTKARCGIFCAQDSAQLWESGGGEPYAELTYLDANRQTVVRSIDNDAVMDASGNEIEDVQILDLGGRLQQGEIVRPLLITETVRALQKLLNMSLTMLSKNVVMGGFLERTLLDVQLPGKMIQEPQSGGGFIERFIPDPINVGAGTFNSFEGKEYTDENGVKQRAHPQVHYRDPVPVTVFLETERATAQALLEEVHQDFVLMNTHATASGKSREMARQEFESDLRVSAASVETQGRWLLETVLAMTAVFMGQAGRYDILRATFECRIAAGERSALDRTEDRNQVAAGLLSRETAMSLNSIEDTDGELTRIDSESERFNLKAQYEEEAAGLLAGIPLDAQWRAQGVSEEEISERVAWILDSVLPIVTPPAQSATEPIAQAAPSADSAIVS